MRLHELLTDGTPANLYHPIVGRVRWAEGQWPGSGFVLSFAAGPEKGRPLLPDASVILDDRWEIYDLQDEIDRLNRLKEEAVQNLDFETAARYRDEADALKRRGKFRTES